MNSKVAQRCVMSVTCLTIVVLVAVIVTVWVMLGQGAFRPQKQPKAARMAKALLASGAPSAAPSSTKIFISRSGTKTISISANKHKETLERSHLGDFTSNDEEFVKPLKISPLPLHDHDIIYDQLHNNNVEKPLLRHHSGHFRHKLAELWDPHPHYQISAFGRVFQLELEDNSDFVSPHLHVTHVWSNYSKRVPHDPRISGCYYKGKVKGDDNSDVVVSLCNGMTGYIRTSDANYFIEPIEKIIDGNENLESLIHRMKKINHSTNSNNNNNNFFDNEMYADEDNENRTIVEDDFPTVDDQHNHHIINKRELHFDDLDTDYVEEEGNSATSFSSASSSSSSGKEEVLRTTRDADWAANYNDDIDSSLMDDKRTNEYYIKVLVVADKSMVDFYRRNDELQHYILTLMSHTALLYKDASIGNAISISVVNIWLLKEIDFTGTNSQVMLRKFCEWQEHNTVERHHNTAILITRNSICKNTSDCRTLGVAEVGSMCDPSSSCAIVTDKGLSSSYTIAHELGHVLSMPHDKDSKCKTFVKDGKEKHIMSYMFQKDTKPWLWSACSKYYVTEFLDSPKAKCLTNKPTLDYITSKFVGVLPGEVFDVDTQCELEQGRGSKICSYMGYCGSLWCTFGEEGGCNTQYLPWAEGTACGRERWCIRGKCVALNRDELIPINGNWGEWQSWGDCSRTCGGGIKKSKRYCDNPIPENGGAYCTGRGVRYASCNTRPCEETARDFREIQCAEFNGRKKITNLSKDVEWVPKYGFLNEPDKLCKLYCRPKDTNAYYTLRDKVIDGTKCGLKSFDICVNGICRSGGCDNKLDSTVTLDECGICGGDSSKCEEVTGSYNISQHGYHRVLRIPKGASNLDIRQHGFGNAEDDNYLVLVDGETGNYILNGKNLVSKHEKDVLFGSVIINYSGSGAIVERIKTPKNERLSKDLVLEVLSGGKVRPPDVTYRYIVSLNNSPRYGWILYEKQWSKCNSLCGGVQTTTSTCMELLTNTPKPETYCLQSEKPIQRRDCNDHCRLIWTPSSYGACSADCGKGMRKIYYNCVKIDLIKENYELFMNTGRTHREIVNVKHCASLTKPPHIEACYGKCESIKWNYSNWNECSKSCDGGIQRRTAHCVDINNKKVDELHCSKLEKIIEQTCNNAKCPIWSAGEWSSCSVTCGRGYRTKPYYCHVDGRIYDSSYCKQNDKPEEKEECVQQPCERWFTGTWSECSHSCGDGIQRREVVCRQLDNKIVNEDHCHTILKPNNTKSCNLQNCEHQQKHHYDYEDDIVDNSIHENVRMVHYQWMTGPWGLCSKSCASGIQTRAVVCRNDFGEENEYLCNAILKPRPAQQCNVQACPVWTFGAWSKCDTTCRKYRQVSCLNSTGNLVLDEECTGIEKPLQKKNCTNNECIAILSTQNKIVKNVMDTKIQKYRWRIGKWKQCTNSCGKGVRRRHIECEDVEKDIKLVDQFCSHLSKPKATKPCERYNCPYAWIESYWSSCSATCGNGMKSRNVTCHKVYAGGIIDPNPLPQFNTISRNQYRNYCNMYNKPITTTNCTLSYCGDAYIWQIGPWKQCSHSCGRKGRQIRQIYCINSRTQHKVQKRYCPKELRPPRKRKCNQWRCLFNNCKEIQEKTKTKTNKDYLMMIHGKTAMVYCYKMDINEPEEFISLQSDEENYAENYHLRLKNTNHCPYNGERREDCDCLPVGDDRSGLTKFWKVRLNITTLEIIGNDYTFSQQTKGKKIPFGTAGDCYSSTEGCPQGRFSIDFTKTSFKLATNIVRWNKFGNFAMSQISIKNNGTRIEGKCGGYCGGCLPDPNVGLKVEII